MKPSMDVRGLIERVEKATGPDREIDWDTQEALFGIDATSFHDTPPYTASIDAALALCERVHPGWQVNIYHYGSAGAQVSLGASGKVRHEASTTPIAIILATLRALTKAAS